MAKNVLIKNPNPAAINGYDEIHPITKAGNVFTSNGKSLEEVAASRDGYGTTTNVGNAYAVTISPAPTVLTESLRVTVKINVDSTGAATLNVNGLGVKAIKKTNGNDATNLKAGSVYTVVYSGSAFILQGEGGDGDAVAGDIRAGKTAETSVGPVTGSLPVRLGGSVTPGPSAISKAAGIYDVPIVVAGVAVPAANVKVGTTIAGTTGAMPDRGAVVLTPGTANVPISNGHHNGAGYVKGYTDSIASNIRSGKVINDIAGTLIEGKRTATATTSVVTTNNFTAFDGSTLTRYSAAFNLSSLPFVCGRFIVVSSDPSVSVLVGVWMNYNFFNTGQWYSNYTLGPESVRLPTSGVINFPVPIQSGDVTLIFFEQ